MCCLTSIDQYLWKICPSSPTFPLLAFLCRGISFEYLKASNPNLASVLPLTHKDAQLGVEFTSFFCVITPCFDVILYRDVSSTGSTVIRVTPTVRDNPVSRLRRCRQGPRREAAVARGDHVTHDSSDKCVSSGPAPIPHCHV